MSLLLIGCDLVRYQWRGQTCSSSDAVAHQIMSVGDTELSMKPGREPSGGEITSENDDMSSDKECERHSRRKSKGSCLKLI